MNGERIIKITNFTMKKILLLLILVSIPGFALASNIYFETSRDTISNGDIFIVSAKIDTLESNINSVEGDFVLESNDGNLIVNDFSLAKSIFTLWPRTPSLSNDGNKISFVGGVPGGVNGDNKTIFSFILEAKKEGTVKISPENLTVFENDGKGTKNSVYVKDLVINILPEEEEKINNDWMSLVTTDKINPEDFTITIGREESLFNGKKFAFFNAIDNQSGISYYEVSENGKEAIRSGSTYVLENQDSDEIILTVTAYDKAGNKTVSIYKNPGVRILGFSTSFFIAIFIIVIIWLVFRSKRNVKNI